MVLEWILIILLIYRNLQFNSRGIDENHQWRLSFLGTAYLKPFIIQKPNKKLYNLGEKVSLKCTLDNSGGNVQNRDITNYAYELYKLGSIGHESKSLKSLTKDTKEVSIDVTTTTEGEYMCVVKRPVVNYYSFQTVRIVLRGKPII